MINIPKEIGALLKNGGALKNIRIHFPNGERKDITNANVVQESFSFTESLCSQSQLQFGLCEASVVQFDVYGIENINGYAIEVFHEIDISSLSEEFIAEYGMTSDDVAFPFYRIPYGKFTVDECMRQSDMKRRRVVAYGEMLQTLKPNKFELAKGEVSFEKGGTYTIDLLKYLYSNVPVDSLLPNVSYIDARNNAFLQPLFLTQWDNGFNIVVNSYMGGSSAESEMLFRIRYKELISFDDAFEEMETYIKRKNPDLYEIFVFDWNSWLKDFIKNLFWFDDAKNYTGRRIELDEDQYIYANCVSNAFQIPVSFSLVDSSGTVLKEIILKNADEVKIEEVIVDAPKLTVSYPLKKGKDKLYYIKDIPYDYMWEYIEAALELCGYFGKIDRYGNFNAISICQRKILYPSDNVFPGKNVHPNVENAECIHESEYMSAWYADEYTKPYDKVCVTYTNTDGEEEYMSHMLVDTESETYNKDDYQTYSLTDNYLVQNGKFSSEDIEQILLTVGEAIKDVKYMPSDVDLSGRPDLEAGDLVQVSTPEGTFETVILRRTLTGIQCLTDNFESKG